MGYGDYTPSGGGRAKPLTKAEIRKMQEAYRQAESISAEVRARERAEQVSIDEKIEKDLSLLT